MSTDTTTGTPFSKNPYTAETTAECHSVFSSVFLTPWILSQNDPCTKDLDQFLAIYRSVYWNTMPQSRSCMAVQQYFDPYRNTIHGSKLPRKEFYKRPTESRIPNLLERKNNIHPDWHCWWGFQAWRTFTQVLNPLWLLRQKIDENL